MRWKVDAFFVSASSFREHVPCSQCRLAAETGPAKTMKLLDDGEGMVFEYLDLAEAEQLYEEIVQRRVYQQGGVAIRDGDRILDAGANIGLFTLFCATQADRLSIAAFEPIPLIVDVLRRNLRDLPGHGSQVLVQAKALGPTATELQPFVYFPSAPGESTAHPKERAETLRQVLLAARDAAQSAAVAAVQADGGSEKGDEQDEAMVTGSAEGLAEALAAIEAQAQAELAAMDRF